MTPLSTAATIYTVSLFLVDLLGGALGYALAYAIRFKVMEVPKGYNPEDYFAFFPWALVLWVVARFLVGLNRFRQRAFDARVLRRIAKAAALATLLVMGGAFYTQVDYSRMLPPIVFVSLLVAAAGVRSVAERCFSHLRVTRGFGVARVALAGVSQAGRMMALKLADDPAAGRRAVGFLTVGDPSGVDTSLCEGLPVLGRMDDVARLADEHRVDEIIVTQPDLAPQQVVEFLLECEKLCLRASVAPNILEMVVSDIHLDEVGGLPLLSFHGSRLRGGNIALKRAFDVAVAATMLLVLSPLLIAIAILIKLTSRGPVFYRQERVTLYGNSFDMLKFRSMRADAELRTGPVWAKEDDDRTTGLGRALRRWNLDELPQLINVVRGDMSLVGPRPERPYFVEQFKDEIPHYMARLKVKAGLTGWAQVNGLRGNTSLSERIRYDLFYVENWSLWFDVKILFMTLSARENAY